MSLENSESNIVVVKVGTNVVTRNKGNQFDLNVMADVANATSEIMEKGKKVILVSSGAVAAGRQVAARHPEIQLPEEITPKSILAKQYMAGIGQPELMATYKGLYLNATPARVASQILVTRNNFADKAGLQHLLGPLKLYLKQGVVPIFNENDTVAIDELKFGDNDQLAAMIAEAVKAELLVLLTDVDGIFEADPKTNPDAQLIHTMGVEEITDGYLESFGDGKSDNGTGGMLSKIKAAQRAALAGTPTVIAHGKKEGNLLSIVRNGMSEHTQKIGTRVLPKTLH